MTAADFAAFIVRAKCHGTYWDGLCPAHEDTTPSLTWTDGDKGVVLNCHRGCSHDEVCGAAGVPVSALFTDTPDRGRPTDDPICATYDYVDESGAPLFQVVRTAGKKFFQRRPTLAGGWINGLDDTRRVLYHLDRLQGQRVIAVVEGEKDCDRLWTLGIPATTNPMGAGKWTAAYTQQLVEAGVETLLLFRDNDTAGATHAETVAQACTGAGRGVRRVVLPDLPPVRAKHGEDVSDWLATHTVEALRAALAAADPASDAPDATATPWAWATSFRGAAITRAVVSRPTFLIEDLLSQAHQHAIIGASGSAKTWLLFSLGVAVALPTVKTFLGQPVTAHGPVVIESWEQGPAEDLRRLQKLLRGHAVSVAPDSLILQSVPLLTLQDEGAYQARLRDLRDAQVVLYAFDSLSEGSGIELNDNTAYTAWWRTRIRPLLDLGITLVYTHLRGHLKPGTRGDRDAAFRGATQIRGLSTAVLECRHLTATTSLLIHNKHRNTAELPLGILTLTGAQDDPSITLDLSALPDAAGKGDRARQQLIALARLHPAGITRKMIEADLNALAKPKASRVSRKTYDPALAALETDGTFEGFTDGKADAWRLVPVADEVEADDD